DDDGAYCEVIDPNVQKSSAKDLGFSELRRLLKMARGGEPAQPLAIAPRILPTSNTTELQPLLVLLNTMVFAATKHQNQSRK
ncbi:unnamed protein product, partial [Polarella glacialis]